MFASDTTVVEFPRLGWGPWELNRYVVKDLFDRFSIAWYGLIICCGMLLAVTVILRNATKREGFKRDSFIDYFLLTIPLSIVGARLMFVLAQWGDYKDNLPNVFKIWEGGLAVYGGVIAGALTVALVSRKKKDPFFKVMDAIVPGLILAQSIGRWGNFVNGEAHGYLTDLPWGMSVNGDGPFHPTFFYESLVTFTGFLLLQFVLYRRKKFDGINTCFYLVWYGAGRTVIEGLRNDSLPYREGTSAFDGSLRISQIIGIIAVVAGVALFFLLRAAAKKASDGAVTEEKTSGVEEEKEEKEALYEETPEEETATEEALEEDTPDEGGATAPEEDK